MAISSMQQPRQMYGLGSFVKKITRPVKKIFKSLLKLSAEKRGEISAQLISSKSLSDEELKNITSELSKVAGSEINFEYKIDQELIGGFKMQLGSLMIDTSIKNKLKQYEQRMLEN